LAVFRPREFLFTDDKEETLRRLKAGGKRARPIAGGTGFYELARRGYIPEVKDLVSLMKLGLNYTTDDPSKLTLGATTKLQDFLDSGLADRAGLEAIGDALREIRPLQIRNVATIGGEVCISVPIVDLPTALLACEASIKIMGPGGSERSLNLEDFYIDAFLTRLNYGEIVKEVIVPKKSRKEHSAFVKLGRTAYDFNLINAAVALSLGADGRVQAIRIFLGGIKRIPLRATNLEKRLQGKQPEEKALVQAAEAAFEKEKLLLPSVHGSREYKLAVLPVVLRDCVMRAYKRAQES
jgi:aerobic carbon-monoxide dehydrogenase medium subunit